MWQVYWRINMIFKSLTGEIFVIEILIFRKNRSESFVMAVYLSGYLPGISVNLPHFSSPLNFRLEYRAI